MISRRQFLRWTSGATAMALAARPSFGAAGVLERLFHGQPAVPTPAITPNDAFYLTSYRSPPTVRVKEWQLRLFGLVERPFSMTYEQLVQRPIVSQIVTLECIGNTVAGEYIGTAEWGGVPLHALLEEAGIGSDTYDVVCHAADAYSDGIRIERALAGDVLVAHRMNGVPLPLAHGHPARLIVPGHYGMKSVQWLTGIELVDRDYQGYYQRKGWTDDATVKTTSWVDVPVHGSTVRGRRHIIRGVAFAGTRGIQRVEVSVDEEESWRPATVNPPLAPAAWIFWQYEWEAQTGGLHSILVRATDGTGRVQTSEEQSPAPDGATGLHQLTVKVAL